MGEFETIFRIRQLAEKAASNPAVSLGIGDDCCLVTSGAGQELALSTDTVVQDVHFRFAYFNHYQVGQKAAAAALSDLAAMAAVPVGALATVSIQAGRSGENVEALAAGLIDLLALYGCPLIGGDLTRSPGPLVVTVTVVGQVAAGQALKRSTARPGDEIWVSGSPGEAGASLACLEQKRSLAGNKLPEVDEHRLHRLHAPVPRLAEAAALLKFGPPTAAIDISDGLAADLGHILESSNVGAELYSENLKPGEFQTAAALALGLPVEYFYLYGGEDYELLFTAAAGVIGKNLAGLTAATGTEFSLIGRITDRPGELALRLPDRNLRPLDRTGYDHFSNDSLQGRKERT